MEFDRFTHEREHLAKGCERIAGVDEVGRGPLAGPVVAAAVTHAETCQMPARLRNSPTKPLVPGRPMLAMVNSRKNTA